MPMNGPDWPPGTPPHQWPHCPTCGRWVHPDLWPGHVGSHDTPADPPPTEDDMNRAHAAHQREEQPK